MALADLQVLIGALSADLRRLRAEVQELGALAHSHDEILCDIAV